MEHHQLNREEKEFLKNKSLTDLDNLPNPDIMASEIIENIESGLNSFKEIMEMINGNSDE